MQLGSGYYVFLILGGQLRLLIHRQIVMKFTTAEYNKIEDSIIQRIERKLAMGATHECAVRWSLETEFIKLGILDSNYGVVIMDKRALVRVNIE